MPDSDSNIIKPVEGLKTITGLSPARRREQRRRQQQQYEPEEQKSEEETIEPTEQQDLTDEISEDKNPPNKIDYQA